jgi:molybdopterin-guanine dinucleotide biosynthesis protein A
MAAAAADLCPYGIMKIIGAIIAGGKSSRMGGREKAFLGLASKPVILHVIEQFEPQVDQLVINANGDAARFSEFGLDVVPDALTSLTTPLAGLHAALKFTKSVAAEVLVTVPSDTPFLPFNLVAKLLEKAVVRGAAIAASGDHEHYIIGAWKADLLDDLERAVARDNLFRVKDWVQRISAQSVVWPVEPYDPFFNVNAPEDLRVAEQILGGA